MKKLNLSIAKITLIILASVLVVKAQEIKETYIGALYVNASTFENPEIRDEFIDPRAGIGIETGLFGPLSVYTRIWTNFQTAANSHYWIQANTGDIKISLGYLPKAMANRHRPSPVSQPGNFEFWSQAAMVEDGFGICASDKYVTATIHKEGNDLEFGAAVQSPMGFILSYHYNAKFYGAAMQYTKGRIDAMIYVNKSEDKYNRAGYLAVDVYRGLWAYYDRSEKDDLHEAGLFKPLNAKYNELAINYVPGLGYRRMNGKNYLTMVLQVWL